MRRTRLRNFLVPSVIFHVALAAFVFIYFAESGEDKGSGSIIVGIVGGEGTEQKGQSAEKSENVRATVSKAANEMREGEKDHTLRPADSKQKSTTTTDIKIAVKSGETKKTAIRENGADRADAVKPGTKPAPGNSSERSALSETAKLDAGLNTGGASANPDLDAGYIKSARPDYRINPRPEYPRAARRRGYEGEVRLRVLVLENGRVGRIEVEKPSGYEVLDRSALEAVSDWIFIPGTENGKEVSSWVTVPVSFRLDNG